MAAYYGIPAFTHVFILSRIPVAMSFIELIRNRSIIAPGVLDPLSALIASRAGFEALYLSGASISYSYLGLPDLSFTNLSDVESALRRIRARVDLPIICDADTGYGNEINVFHTVKILERSGASAIQIEDQDIPKRCGHLSGKSVIPSEEMILKIRSALQSRREAAIIARTDSASIYGIEDAIDRANLYHEEGADIIFVESPRTVDEIEAIARNVKGPKLINMVEGGKTPIIGHDRLRELGFNIIIYPGSAARTIAYALTRMYSALKNEGTTLGLKDIMVDFNGLQEILGTDEITGRFSPKS